MHCSGGETLPAKVDVDFSAGDPFLCEKPVVVGFSAWFGSTHACDCLSHLQDTQITEQVSAYCKKL